MTKERTEKLGRRMIDAAQRARDAKARGDIDGYRYSIAEAHRIGRILAEG